MKTSVLRSTPVEEDSLDMPTPSTRSGRRRTWLLAVVGIVAIIAILVGIKASQIVAMINGGKHFVMPPDSVTSAKVEQVKWQGSRSAVGTLVAVRSVTVSSELPGSVREVGFESGSVVRRGDVLIKLDTSTEEAQLAAAEADTALAKANLKRASVLREQNSNAPADLDTAESRAQQTAANSAMLKATLAKKIIRAPFDGRIGIRQVELGQVLAPGTAIASLQSVSPIYAEFWLPQQALAELRVGQETRLHVDVYPTETWTGTITTVNPEVDVSTRNVRVRATFPNPDGRLRPGMFANVEIVSNEERMATVIPQTAVIYAPYGDSIFAIEEKDKALTVRQKFVRLGERRGDLVSVVSGVNPGETIVSTGAFKLHNGSSVVVVTDPAPASGTSPKPTDDK